MRTKTFLINSTGSHFSTAQKSIAKFSSLAAESYSLTEEIWSALSAEAENVVQNDSSLRTLAIHGVLQHASLREAISYQLSQEFSDFCMSPEQWRTVFKEAYENCSDSDLEHTACLDLLAITEKDPACDSLFTPFIFFKGYKSLQAHRVSHALWLDGRKDLASWIQSRISHVYAVDIHPGATLGNGIVLDHATGVVIGETAVVGDNCYFLHGVTLGGNGKDSGDRHPKLGNNVVMGCHSTVLGNIFVGHGTKTGAGAVVIRTVANNSTAVGFPCRTILPRATYDDYCI